MNTCFGTAWVPFNISGFMLITVMSSTVIIRVHTGLAMGGIAGSLAATCFLGQFVMTYFASNSAEFSKMAILQKRKMSSNSNYDHKHLLKSLKACKEFALKSGSFRIIDREALKIVLMANIDYTISFLLVVGKALEN